MDKRRLVAMVRFKTGWDRTVASQATEVVLDSVRDLVRRGNRLIVHGFGSFTVRLVKPRRARNLKTGQVVLVPARKRVKFKASDVFLE